jgi:hypothetical protein
VQVAEGADAPQRGRRIEVKGAAVRALALRHVGHDERRP